MGAAGKLLVVDDDAAIVAMLNRFLRMEGYETLCARSGEAALEVVSSELARGGRIDLVLLDVSMPGTDGLEVCRRIREHLGCPIMFLTARVDEADQLAGFAVGADDYVMKPFSLDVLGARVRAHLAGRSRHLRAAEQIRLFEGVAVDFGERQVRIGFGEDARVLPLTRTEFDIVALLCRTPGRVWDRERIYEEVWGWDAGGDPAVVREHVRRIRGKFERVGVATDVIETVWGVGYRWVA